MRTGHPLVDTLTRTLAVKAGQAMAADPEAGGAPAFDPTARRTTTDGRSAPTGVPDDVPAIAARSRRRVPRAAAAVVVVVALAAAVTVTLRGRADEAPADTITLGPPPDAWLVPTWVPEGQEPWGIDWRSSSGALSPTEPAATIPQLFGDPDGGRAIYVTSLRYEPRPEGARTVSVRGASGRTGRAWDEAEADVGDAITWEERGATLTALYRGVSRDEAVDALDSLAWRSDDPADGFAPPPGGSWPLRAEVPGRRPASRSVSLQYSDGVPVFDGDGDRPGLEVHTSSSSEVSTEYLEAWYRQGSAAGGGEHPLTSFDEEWHELAVTWPDGRSITVRPTGVPQADLPSRATLQRIVDSLAVAGEAELAGLRATAGANAATMPVLASAPTAIGTVEVHGQDGYLRLCLGAGDATGGAGAPRCTTGNVGSGPATATGEWTIDGTWYAVVATRGDAPPIVGGRTSRSPDAGELPAESATSGDWTIRVVRAAPDVEMVCIEGGGGSLDCPLHRSD